MEDAGILPWPPPDLVEIADALDIMAKPHRRQRLGERQRHRPAMLHATAGGHLDGIPRNHKRRGLTGDVVQGG